MSTLNNKTMGTITSSMIANSSVPAATVPKIDKLIEAISIVDDSTYMAYNMVTSEVVTGNFAKVFHSWALWSEKTNEISIQKVKKETAEVLYGSKG